MRRRRQLSPPLACLIGSSFAIPLGSFSVLPFLSIYLHDRLHLGLGLVGLILAVATFVQFAGGLGGSFIAGRAGLKKTMLTALGVRTAGFALLVPSMETAWLALPALLCIAAGSALYLPANKGYVVSEVPEADRPRMLGYTYSATNAGTALGPLASGLFILADPAAVFGCVAVLFALVFVAHAIVLPTEVGGREAPAEIRLRTRSLLSPPVITTISAIYVYMYFQNYLGVYIALRHSPEFYSALLLINGLLVVFAQPATSSRISAMPYPWAIAAAFGAFALGLLALQGDQPLLLLLGTLAITWGEIVIFLKNDLEMLKKYPDQPTLAFGHARLAAGIGAFFSGVLGGQLYGRLVGQDGSGSFWILVAVQALLLGGICALFVLRVDRVGARTFGGVSGAVPTLAPSHTVPQGD